MSENPEAQGGRHLSAGAVASLLGLVVLLIFIVQNTEAIEFHFVVWRFSWPLWVYTIIAALFGGLVWFGVGVIRRHRRRAERRDSR